MIRDGMGFNFRHCEKREEWLRVLLDLEKERQYVKVLILHRTQKTLSNDSDGTKAGRPPKTDCANPGTVVVVSLTVLTSFGTVFGKNFLRR